MEMPEICEQVPNYQAISVVFVGERALILRATAHPPASIPALTIGGPGNESILPEAPETPPNQPITPLFFPYRSPYSSPLFPGSTSVTPTIQTPTGSLNIGLAHPRFPSGYTPQSATQRVMFLRRYISSTISQIESTKHRRDSIQRRLLGLGEGFPQFARLPLEIQLMVWKYAVPDARDVSNAILVIVNHNLGDVKAILPKPKEYKQIYSDIFARTLEGIRREGGEEGGEAELELDPDDYRWNVKKHLVFSLMQTCHDSRVEVLKKVCLDVEPVSNKAARKLPWSADDSLYFPCLGYSFERRMALKWLSRSRARDSEGVEGEQGEREKGPPSLVGIKHLALPLERILLQALGITRPFLGRNPGRNQWDNAWFKNMPGLESLELYLDPGDVSEKDQGELRLYEPEEVPIFHCARYTPSEAVKAVQDKLKELTLERDDRQGLLGMGKDVPSVDISVLCWKKPKGYVTPEDILAGPPKGLGPAGVTMRIASTPEDRARLMQQANAAAVNSLEQRQHLEELREHLTAHLP